MRDSIKIFVSLFALVSVAGGYYAYSNYLNNKETHYHAGFKIYIDTKPQDFSDLKYMHVKPCSDKTDHDREDPQIEKAHLHDFIGDVVHVHRNNASWGDLFKNIKFDLPPSKPVVAYINTVKIINIMHYPIKPYDSLVLIIGKTVDLPKLLEKNVTREHIIETEKKSENCGDKK